MTNQNNLTAKEEQIIAIIKEGKSATFAECSAIVKQPMLKTNNPLKDAEITKLTKYNVMLNTNYAKRVNNSLIREGKEADFVAKENWHEKVYDTDNGSIVCNRNKKEDRYLMVDVNKAETLKYFVNGIEATADEMVIIKQFKQKSSTAPHQGLTDEVTVRTIKISGITELRANKVVATW